MFLIGEFTRPKNLYIKLQLLHNVVGGGLMHTISGKKLLMLRPSDIKIISSGHRKSFDEYELKLLADSISSNGIIQPLAVRRAEEGKYEIIAGERRYKAAVMAGLRRIPCVLHRADCKTVAVYSIVENLQRSNLTMFEEADALRQLTSVYGMSQIETAVRLGISQSTLSNKMRLLKLDSSLRERIEKARLTERHARALLRIAPNLRENALDYIIANGLTVKQTDEYIEGIINPKIKEESPEPTRKFVIGDVRLFYNSLSKLVDTLQSAGVDAKARKYENDKYIEYKVRIKKEQMGSNKCKQLKIC